jgi:putative PIN family toxin of toxin-antitoxin system
MLRAVVDPGVLISSLISSRGAPSELVRRWIEGEFQLLWSPQLLDELTLVCARPRFREWFSPEEAAIIVGLIRDAGEAHADALTDAPPPPDDGDRYLIDLAVSSQADCLVTGDLTLLSHAVPGLRIASPRTLLDVLDALGRQ